MTIDNERMIADAKRAARRLARTCGLTYQECLDTIAREAGRRHWADFLADPVDTRAERRAAGAALSVAAPGGGKSAGEVIPAMLDGSVPLVVIDPKPAIRPHDGHAFGVREDLVDGLLGGEGVLLGMDGMRFVRSARNSAVLCVGEPGTGKTTGIVVPTLALSPHASQIVHDVKPELLSEALRLRAMGLRPDARILALDALGGSTPEGVETIAFNPLHPDFRGDESPYRHALRIAAVLIPDRPRGDAYFRRRGRLMLAALMTLLSLRPQLIPGDRPRVGSLPAVTDWLARTVEGDQTLALRQAFEACGDDPELAEVADEMAAISRIDARERSGILGTVDQALIFTKNREVRRTLDPENQNDGALLIRAMRDPDRAVSLYLTSNAAICLAAAPVAALAMETVVAWRSRRGPSARSLQVVIDEVGKTTPIPAIDAILREGPPAGVSLLVVETQLDMERAAATWAIGGPLTMRFDHVVDMKRRHTDADTLTIGDLASVDPGRMPEAEVMNADDESYMVVAKSVRRRLSPCGMLKRRRTP